MADKYDIGLSKAQRNLFIAWDKQFPPKANKKSWAEAVGKIEGYPNPYITNHKLKTNCVLSKINFVIPHNIYTECNNL